MPPLTLQEEGLTKGTLGGCQARVTSFHFKDNFFLCIRLTWLHMAQNLGKCTKSASPSW